MSKRKVQFADPELGEAVQGSGSQAVQREQNRRFKEKHSLDSDEEDEEKEERMDEEDIEGQEEGDVGYDEGITITPFNMREELEEGHFDKDGTYIFAKEGLIRDEWMDNIDWVRIKETEGNVAANFQEDSDSEPENIDVKNIYSQMVEHIKPGESVAKALRRLGGNKGKQMSSSQRWKAKKQKTEAQSTEADAQLKKDKEDFLTLTGLADKILQSGNMEVYEMTLEKLNYELKKDEKPVEKLKIPEGTNDDDALDMFADDFDKKESDKIGKDLENMPENGTQVSVTEDSKEESKSPDASDEVMWEYKWEDKDGEEIHGPYSSSEMLKWTEDDYFKDGVYCRKVGSDSQFYSSKRIDFDLYT